MADQNESPSATEKSSSQELINTTYSGEEECHFPEPPAYSLDDPNARENNRTHWTPDEDDVEQEGYDYNAATEVEYEENAAASSRLYRDHPKTYDGSQHYAGRRQVRVQTRQFAGHYFVKDYLRATAAKSGRPYLGQTHPAQPHPVQPHYSTPHQVKPHSAEAYPARPYHKSAHPLDPYSSHTARPAHSDRAQIHRYLEASPAPYQDQVLSLTPAERPDPPVPTFDIVYIPRKRPNRHGNGRSYIAFSVFVCFCCCLPLGLLAIYLSYQAKTSWLKGAYRRAKSFSIAALVTNILGVILGIVLAALLIWRH
ncbi:unnamed protein product [Lymnaea stagnalis]|uniref:Uncharacterized protein n=1 Tax=Lymnaea stagnalis TaxID=6523 RepID=A0AAV2H886_LYMST